MDLERISLNLLGHIQLGASNSVTRQGKNKKERVLYRFSP